MFGNQYLNHLRELFAEQFEVDGKNFLYRKSGKGAAIRVSAAERDGFVESFNRRLRHGTWAILVATVALFGVLIALIPDVDSDQAKVATYAGVSFIIAIFLAGYYSAWNAPMRELDRRPVAQPALSGEEARRVALSKVSYGQLSLAVIAALAIVWNALSERGFIQGWGVLWLAFAGILIVGAGVQAFRKWRLGR